MYECCYIICSKYYHLEEIMSGEINCSEYRLDCHMIGLEKKVLEFIHRHALISRGNRLLLSLSAGKDSMALLHILYRMREELSISLEIFHLNHTSRGEESDADETFLLDVAKWLDVPIIAKSVDVMGSRPGGCSFEEHARNVRYTLAHEIARERKCDAIATAHTRDDSVETILMRLFQGTGLHGLRGIEPRRGIIIRPILCLSSEEVYRYLRSNAISWRDDATNADTQYLRNFIRHELLPVVQKRFPDGAAAVARLSDIAHDELLLSDELIRELYGKDVLCRKQDSVKIAWEKVRGKDLLVKHLLARAFHELGGYISTGMIEDIMRKLKGNRTNEELFRGRGLRAVKTQADDGVVILISRDETIEKKDSWEYHVLFAQLPQRFFLREAGLHLEFFFVDEDFFLKNKNDCDMALVSLKEDDTALIVRSRRPGDRISCAGGEKKIKELFIDRKLSPEAKERVPIIAVGGRIAAVLLGFLGSGHNRIADDFLVNSGSKKILAIRKA